MIAYVALHAIIYFYYDKGLKISIRAQTPTNNKLRRLQEWNKLVIVLVVLSFTYSFIYVQQNSLASSIMVCGAYWDKVWYRQNWFTVVLYGASRFPQTYFAQGAPSNVISNLVAPFLLPHTWTSIMDIW